MKNLLFLFSDAAASGVQIMVCLFLISRLLSADKPGKKSFLTAWGTSVVVVFLTVYLANRASTSGIPPDSRIFRTLPCLNLTNLLPTALEVLSIAACAVRFQGADARMSLFVGIFYKVGVSFWQFLADAGLSILFHSPAFFDHRTENGQASIWLLHGLLIFLAWYLFGRREVEGKEAFSIASAITLAGFLAVVSLSEQTVLEIPGDTLDMWTLLSVILMMSVLVFRINRQYEMEKELAVLKAQQAELLERDYLALNNAYAVNAKLFHDFHNHIGALRQLLSHEKVKEAVEYLDELQTPVREMADTARTGDETIDYLINSKAAAAADNEISFQAQIEFPRHTNIRSADLCAILGNFLDNALDAAKQVPKPEKRLIRLTIRRINQMLVIKVENSFSAQPVAENGSLVTTKKEGGLHGWGLKSARTAAEKYDGMVQTSHADHMFRAVATLSYQGISTA